MMELATLIVVLMLCPCGKERALPSRGILNLIVEKKECHDWSNVLDALLSAITDSDMESWREEVAGIASSLDGCADSCHNVVAEERSRIQREIEKLQLQMAALGDHG